MVDTERKSGEGKENLILLNEPYRPFNLNEYAFDRLKAGHDKKLEKKLTLHTSEFPDIPLFFLLGPLSADSQTQGISRNLAFEIATQKTQLENAGFLQKRRKSSSLGKTNQIEYEDVFLEMYLEKFKKLGVRVAVPFTDAGVGGFFDGVINRDHLDKGRLVIDTFIDRDRDALSSSPLVLPILNQSTVNGLQVAFSYEKPSLPDIYLNTVFDFEDTPTSSTN